MKNTTGYKYYYARRLPHYQPIGYTYFITFRLANSLPKQKIIELINEKEKFLNVIAGYKNEKKKAETYHTFQKEYFLKYEDLLDSPQSGPLFIKREEVAQIIVEAIHYREDKEYSLLGFTIMANHVHLLFRPIIEGENPNEDHVNPYHVTKILQSLKSNTARKINKVLQKNGQLWHNESYDHVVRDEKELREIANYILNNPVKAGLVDDLFKYKWTYINYELL